MRLRRWMTGLGAGLLLLALVLSVLYLTATRWIADEETESGETLPAGVPGRLVRVGGHRVHVVESGTGPAILLVHGTAGTTLDWETSVLEDLARDHHVIALDLYGMGFSDRDGGFPYGFALWTDQLVQTLDALGVERAAVIGQSLGGAISLVFAGRYPARVERVVSVDSGPWLPPFLLPMLTPGLGEMLLARGEYWPDRPDQGAVYARRMREVYGIKGTRESLLRAMRGQFIDGRAYFGGLAHVGCPTLLIQGESDDIIPTRAAQALQKLLSGSELVLIPGGHFSMQDSPGRFLQEVRRFLDGPQPAPAR
jgi:pimeloyl-ACP methyl ester carboxylesterase